MYYIEERYEYWGQFGKNWTRWCRHLAKYRTEEEAKEALKRQPKLCNKLKYDYRIVCSE